MCDCARAFTDVSRPPPPHPSGALCVFSPVITTPLSVRAALLTPASTARTHVKSGSPGPPHGCTSPHQPFPTLATGRYVVPAARVCSPVSQVQAFVADQLAFKDFLLLIYTHTRTNTLTKHIHTQHTRTLTHTIHTTHTHAHPHTLSLARAHTHARTHITNMRARTHIHIHHVPVLLRL